MRLCLGLVSVMCSAAAFGQAQESRRPEHRVLASTQENQRYVFGQISDYRRDQYMLDTRTGRLWRIVTRKLAPKEGETPTGDGFEVLEPVPYTNVNDGRLSITP